MISEVIREDEHSNSSNNCEDSSKSNHSDDDFDKKSDNAIDYSDINELAEDLQVLMQEVNICIKKFHILKGTNLQSVKEKDDTNYDDIEDSIPVNKVSTDAKFSDQRTSSEVKVEVNSESKCSFIRANQVLGLTSVFYSAPHPSNDKDLMPPPSLPLKSQIR